MQLPALPAVDRGPKHEDANQALPVATVAQAIQGVGHSEGEPDFREHRLGEADAAINQTVLLTKGEPDHKLGAEGPDDRGGAVLPGIFERSVFFPREERERVKATMRGEQCFFFRISTY